MDVPQDMAVHIEKRPSAPGEGRITNDNRDFKDILQRTIKVKRYDGTEVQRNGLLFLISHILKMHSSYIVKNTSNKQLQLHLAVDISQNYLAQQD